MSNPSLNAPHSQPQVPPPSGFPDFSHCAALAESCLLHPIAGTTNANLPQGVVLLDEKK